MKKYRSQRRKDAKEEAEFLQLELRNPDLQNSSLRLCGFARVFFSFPLPLAAFVLTIPGDIREST
jgi:hypothetical protein